MNHFTPEEEILEDVMSYELIRESDEKYSLADRWSGGSVSYGMTRVDGADESAMALMNSYKKLHRWTIETWEENHGG